MIVENVSRRRFLQGGLAAGALVLSARFVSKRLWAAHGDEAAGPMSWMRTGLA